MSSQEFASKYSELKSRTTEMEEENDRIYLKLIRLRRMIKLMNLERAHLLEVCAKNKMTAKQ